MYNRLVLDITKFRSKQHEGMHDKPYGKSGSSYSQQGAWIKELFCRKRDRTLSWSASRSGRSVTGFKTLPFWDPGESLFLVSMLP